MSFLNFNEATETYLTKDEAIQYLVKQYKAVPHIVRMILSNKYNAKSDDFPMITFSNFDEFSLSEIDDIGKYISSKKESMLDILTQKVNVVSVNDIYIKGYDYNSMSDWEVDRILEHVYFMKFKNRHGDTNIWEYEEIKLSESLAYSSVRKKKTNFPVTEQFVRTNRRIDNFGELIKIGRDVYKRNSANYLKIQQMGNLERALLMKQNEENVELEVFEMVMRHLVFGSGEYKHIIKAYSQL
jgi:hypothetical protein